MLAWGLHFSHKKYQESNILYSTLLFWCDIVQIWPSMSTNGKQYWWTDPYYKLICSNQLQKLPNQQDFDQPKYDQLIVLWEAHNKLRGSFK